MDGSLYSCEMRFDPDHASVCHALTAAAVVSIHCVYIHNRRARLSCCQTKVDLAVSRSLLRPFFPLSFPRLCEIISHVLQSEDRSTARFALSQGNVVWVVVL